MSHFCPKKGTLKPAEAPSGQTATQCHKLTRIFVLRNSRADLEAVADVSARSRAKRRWPQRFRVVSCCKEVITGSRKEFTLNVGENCCNTMMELKPIVLPADWTPEKDFEAYEERWGEAEGDYFSAVLERVAEYYRELVKVVDAALAYFQRTDHRLVPVHPETLPLCEKLTRLSAITNMRKATYRYKSRFAEHLHNASWVDNERRRVLETYYLGEEDSWLHPLCELADYLACAAFQLEEAMECEHDDYDDTSGKG
jgi:hypothetical protein